MKRTPSRSRSRTTRRASSRTASHSTRSKKAVPGRRWSGRVTRESNALDLESGVFTRSPRTIALSLKRSAERSTRRKSSSYHSAMSMLTFFINRAGRSLSPERRDRLERAKGHLRAIYGRSSPERTSGASRRSRKLPRGG